MMMQSLLNTSPALQKPGSPAGGAVPSASDVTPWRGAPAVAQKARVEFLDPAEPRDRAAWLALWERWPDRELMAHPDYVRLFARPGDRVVAAVLRIPDGGILYPFILRPLAAEPWAAAEGRGCDLTTPYGYGGPFAWNVSGEEAQAFWAGFEEWTRDQQVVSSFDRLSLFSEQLLPFNGEIETKGTNIVRRLDLPEAELWAEYTQKVRQNVNRGRRLGLSVEVNPSDRRLDEFMEIYISTMTRRNASSGYFHPRSFFESIIRDLTGHFSFFTLHSEGRVISSELVLLSENSAYSFLGGSLKEAFDLRANDLFKHEIITWCRNAGKKVLVLGGGYRGSDGILAFKKSFAPHGEVDFKVGKRTYDAARCQRLEEQRRSWEKERGVDWIPDPQHFPVYRA